MTKVVYIVSDIDKALAFEWVAANLNRNQYDLEFVLLNNNNSALEKKLVELRLPTTRIVYKPGWHMIFSFWPLFSLLKSKNIDVVHTHLRTASILGLLSAFLLRIDKRVMTRHHAASNHHYHPHAVKQDKFLSRLATHVVSISDVVTDVLVDWENTPNEKVVKIPHGFDLILFKGVSNERVVALRNKYIPNIDGPIIGVISRYLELKGIQYTIDAFIKLLQSNPKAHLILANATGPWANQIKVLLKTIPPTSYTEVIFESDVPALYRLFDLYVHVPISKHSEAFGQTYIESLASGIPSIFTLSGIACEMIAHEKNALVVPFKDSEAIFEAMNRIMNDKKLTASLVENGLRSVQDYNLPPFIARLEALYA